MNVFEFAMQMELDGRDYYEKLSAETPFPGLRTIFTRLAEDERKHYDTILSIQAGTPAVMPDSTVLAEAKNLFRELLDDRGKAAALSGSLDGYRHAMENEANSIQLYENLAKKESNPETLALVRRIIEEEKKHYNIVENLYDFVLAPLNYLEWAEFSNLRTL